VLTSLSSAALGLVTTTSSSTSTSSSSSMGKGRACHPHPHYLLLPQAVLGPLAALTALRRLSLAYTRVTGRQLEEVGAVLPPGLVALDLSGNVGVSPRGLGALAARRGTLTELHLRGVKVGGWVGGWVCWGVRKHWVCGCGCGWVGGCV
jgi:hypothetical protein